MQLELPDDNNNNTAETQQLTFYQPDGRVPGSKLWLSCAVESLSFLDIAFVTSRKWFGFNARM